MVLKARQTFPNEAKIRLIWGAGIAAPSGVATDADQRLEFQTRPRFTVETRCERENAKADCTPLTPVRLVFSSPVSWAAGAAGPPGGERRQAHRPGAAGRAE